jgi:hypothetical protein
MRSIKTASKMHGETDDEQRFGAAYCNGTCGRRHIVHTLGLIEETEAAATAADAEAEQARGRVLDPTVTDAHKAHVALEAATFRGRAARALATSAGGAGGGGRSAPMPELTPGSFGCASLTRYDAQER